jgi:hypothetical protein
MTNEEKRELRVWAFEAVAKRPPRVQRINGETLFDDLSIIEQIGEAAALAEWVSTGRVDLT